MNLSQDQVFQLLGQKEAEVQVLRAQVQQLQQKLAEMEAEQSKQQTTEDDS